MIKAACGHALKAIPTENDILSTPCLTLLVLFKEKQNVEEIANGMSSSKFIILNNIFSMLKICMFYLMGRA